MVETRHRAFGVRDVRRGIARERERSIREAIRDEREISPASSISPRDA
jgi:hypothetical protein